MLPRGPRIGSSLSVVLYGVFALLMLQAAGPHDVLPSGPAVVCSVLARH